MGWWCSVHVVFRVVFGVRYVTGAECFGVFLEIVWGVDCRGRLCGVGHVFFVAMMCDRYCCVGDGHVWEGR